MAGTPGPRFRPPVPVAYGAAFAGEGDARRVMTAMVIGCVLNIALDPLFIYRFEVPRLPGLRLGLGLGVEGAAYATVLSMAVSSVLLLYWLFIQRRTYLVIHFRGFRMEAAITRRIMAIGVPTMLMQMSMSVMMFGVTSIITRVSGDTGVAVFSSGWRIVQVATLPILGIGSAVTAVCGAAYGARAYDKLSLAKGNKQVVYVRRESEPARVEITEFRSLAIGIVTRHFGNLDPARIEERSSGGGKYLGLTITVRAESKAQLDAVYMELTSCRQVLVAL